MPDKPTEDSVRRRFHPEPTPVFVRVHTRVVDEKPRKNREGKLPDKWARFALIFDCETTTDIRQDLNFLWWRFCELRAGKYVCQQEGLVYADSLDEPSIDLIHAYARSKRAQVEDGCPENILVQSRTEFVDGEFWQAIQAGAVIVCFNAPFDLSRLALDYREAQRKNSGWSMVMWEHEGKPDSFKPKLRIKPKDSRSAFINLAGGDPNNRVVLTAAKLEVVDCTAEARDILNGVDVQSILKPSKWLDLAFFASITPSEDMLPVRALYSDIGETNIGLNPLTANEPIWYAGPDLAASRIATKRTPKIIEAFRLVPHGMQESLKSTVIGTRTIDPKKDDFFRAVIEERKKLPKSHPHNLLLKMIANALYGVFAELNKEEFGKNSAKTLDVFSGEYNFQQSTFVVERPGKLQFPPAAALITAGGRLMLAILERMVKDLGGTYLLTDTDSMLFIASKRGGLVPCAGGPHRTKQGAPAIKTISWKQVQGLCRRLNSLNPYNKNMVEEILKIEECNFDRDGNQHQLYGLAVSAKRYVVYARENETIEIIKPSEHGLGIVYVPDKRPRYKPVNCKDQESNYPRWIVEAWERLLLEHFRNLEDPENALVSRELWFDNLPAVMRVRVTTPNVLKALRKRDPGAAKPYNFAVSPILINPSSDCTLIAPASKHFAEWLARDYTEIHSGQTLKLFSEYNGRVLTPQTLSSVIWRHYLHPEDKSLSPDGERCGAYTRGLLLRRPIQAMTPLIFIGKEIERRSQEGEDISVLQSSGSIKYHARQRVKTRPADAGTIARARRFGLRQLMRESGRSQHPVQRFLDGDPVHPAICQPE
jgi:hypothetical protein